MGADQAQGKEPFAVTYHRNPLIPEDKRTFSRDIRQRRSYELFL
jgi:hypothetical protein